MAMQRRNEQKVVNHSCAKAQRKWDKLVIVAKQCPQLLKPTLVKLILKKLLQMLGLMHGVWEACLKMQHHKWKGMKIYYR